MAANSDSQKPDQPTDLPADYMHPVSTRLFGWVAHPRIGSRILITVLSISLLLLVTDIFVHRHEYLTVSESFGFYGFWGFGAFTFVVLMGWPLGKLLRRSEDFYDEADTRPRTPERGK